MEQKYIGTNKVMGVVEVEFTTSSGGKVIEVLFEDGKKKIMTQKAFDLLASTEVVDATSTSNKKKTAVLAECMKVIEEYDLEVNEWEGICRMIITSLNENLNRATNYLWFKDDSRFIAGYDSEREISLLMIKDVVRNIKTNGEKDSTNK